MNLDEKRAQYSVKSNYVTLSNIKPWSEYVKTVKPHQSSPGKYLKTFKCST